MIVAGPVGQAGGGEGPNASESQGNGCGGDCGSVLSWKGIVFLNGVVHSQGSKRIGRNRATGKPILLDADEGLKAWRAALSAMMRLRRPTQALACAVEVGIIVLVERPQSHYGTGRNTGKLKASVPHYPSTGRDLDKVARGCLDAGTLAGWWVDDQRVTKLCIWREWSVDQPGISVTAWAMR